MSRHSFDPEVAAHVGLNAAVIYQNIVWWCEKNAANGKHCYEGRHWTYNSVKAFGDLFPYLSADQIRRALEKLVECGYVGVGTFNASPYDKTKWYCDLRQTDLANLPNGGGEDAEPIPDSKPVQKPDGKHLGDFDAFWAEVPRKEGKGDARRAYERALKKTDHATIIAAMRDYASRRKGEDPKFTKMPASWLNAERWDDAPAARPQDFHKQLEDIFNELELRDARLDHSAGSEHLPAPIQNAGPSRPGDGPSAHQTDGGRYQQEITRFLMPKRFGGAAW